MEHCQRQLGLPRGAARYAEVLQLIDALLKFSRKMVEFMIYYEMVIKLSKKRLPTAPFLDSCVIGNAESSK
jgi:hypothetical protein